MAHPALPSKSILLQGALPSRRVVQVGPACGPLWSQQSASDSRNLIGVRGGSNTLGDERWTQGPESLPAQSQAARGTRDARMTLLSFVICKTSAPLSGELGKEGSAQWGP